MDPKRVATIRDRQATPPAPAAVPEAAEADGYAAVTQYSVRQVLGAWAAAAVPMGLLAWLVTPWLAGLLSGPDPFITALLLCFLAGLLGQLALVLLLVRREQGSLRWSRVRAALWLRRPRSPRTGRTGGRVWWWAVPFVLLSAAVNAVGIDPVGPIPRDLPATLEQAAPRLEHFFHGNWSGFGLLVAVSLLSPVVEELFFRGLLLPRMRAAFGAADVVVNGVIFGLYHLHQPWSMPASVIDGIVSQAYPTKRFQSTWFAIFAHTAPSFVIIGAVVLLVL
jgi:membrane protease YdiL (CAAX protease family)